MKWLHAARYIKSVKINDEALEINTWSSKLGKDKVVSHNDPETVKCVYNSATHIFYAEALEYKDLSWNSQSQTSDIIS